MTGQVTISLNTRKGNVRTCSYPHMYTLEQSIAGTIPAAFWTNISQLEDAFQGVVNISEGVYRSTTVSFPSETINKSTPAVQTHEEKVVLVLELYAGTPFPDKQFSVSVPMPDLVNDFVFPAGTDRIVENEFAGNLSANAIAWVNNTLEHYLDHMNPAATWSAVRALYIDLVGTSV